MRVLGGTAQAGVEPASEALFVCGSRPGDSSPAKQGQDLGLDDEVVAIERRIPELAMDSLFVSDSG